MKRLLALMVLPIILIQMLLMPAVTYGEFTGCPAITVTTLPATDITMQSAVLHGVMCLQLPPRNGQPKGQECEGVMVFEYGIAHHLYTNQVPADVVSAAMVDNRLCHTVEGLLGELNPCTTYYVRLKYVFIEDAGIPGDLTYGVGVGLDPAEFIKSIYQPRVPAQCPSVYYSNEISFRTAGCELLEDETHQSGGVGTVAPTTRPFIMSNIVVQSAALASAKVSPGENVDVAATVTNKGGSNGTSKVTLYINGQEAESKGITLASGGSTQVHFSVSRNDPGTYTVYVNGVSAGSFTVDLFTNNDILIYSIIALFTIGIIGVLYLVFRRRTA